MICGLILFVGADPERNNLDTFNMKDSDRYILDCNESKSDSLEFTAELNEFMNVYVWFYVAVQTDDVVFLAGKDAGWFDNLSITVEYYK